MFFKIFSRYSAEQGLMFVAVLTYVGRRYKKDLKSR